jgi:hypothetical protein
LIVKRIGANIQVGLGNGVFTLVIVTEKGAGVNTAGGNIITDLSKLEITADGDLILKANLSSQTDISLTS